MNHGKRMNDLEASITADQIFLRWLDATISKFDSLKEYMKWAGQDPGNRLPFPTFERELTPYATSKTREKASERRAVIVTQEPADLLDLYDRLRAQHGGVGAAALRRGQCQGCHLSLNTVDLNAIRAADPDDVLRCEECRRILVRTDESGL